MVEAERSFNCKIFNKAWEPTIAFYKSRMIGVLLTLLGVTTAGAVTYFGLPGVPVWQRIGTFILVTVTPMGVAGMAIFIWHLFIAPSELVYEAIMTPESTKRAKTFARVTPNYDTWKARSHYTVDEFAALCDAHEPKCNTRSPKAEGIIELLLEQIREKKLETESLRKVRPYTDESYEALPDMNTRIPKSAAIPWAENLRYDVSKLK